MPWYFKLLIFIIIFMVVYKAWIQNFLGEIIIEENGGQYLTALILKTPGARYKKTPASFCLAVGNFVLFFSWLYIIGLAIMLVIQY